MVAAERTREAAEINDSIVQHLAAAKWSLKAGHGERGIELLTGTIESAEALVADLLDGQDDPTTTRPVPAPPGRTDRPAPPATNPRRLVRVLGIDCYRRGRDLLCAPQQRECGAQSSWKPGTMVPKWPRRSTLAGPPDRIAALDELTGIGASSSPADPSSTSESPTQASALRLGS